MRVSSGEELYSRPDFFLIISHDRMQEFEQLLGFVGVFLTGNIAAEGTQEINVVHECPPLAKGYLHTKVVSGGIQKTLYVG